MKPILLMFVASALIAQVPTQTVSIPTALEQISFLKEVSDSYLDVFAHQAEAAAYFKGRSDAFAISAEVVGRAAGTPSVPAAGPTSDIER